MLEKANEAMEDMVEITKQITKRLNMVNKETYEFRDKIENAKKYRKKRRELHEIFYPPGNNDKTN